VLTREKCSFLNPEVDRTCFIGFFGLRASIGFKVSRYFFIIRKFSGKYESVSDSDAEPVATLCDDFGRLSCHVTRDSSLDVKAALKYAESSTVRIIEDCLPLQSNKFEQLSSKMRLILDLKAYAGPQC
jgi:hypothetical protein